MKIKRKIRRTTRQYITVALICIIVIGGAATLTAITITGQIKEEYRLLLEKADREKVMNQRYVYLAVSDIKSGEFITRQKIEKKLVYASQPEETYVGTEGIGKIAMVDIPAGTHIMNNMLTTNQVASELRELEYDVILINSNIVNNDYVDVRLMFPNGEDYIVLSKKIIQNITRDTNSCFLWLEEEEILRMASAIVDAYLYSGSKIYTTKYIEPNIQEASQITYEPSVSTLSLIQNNPNIIKTAITELNKQLRKAMENRLADSFHTEVQEIDWDLSNYSASEDKTAESIPEDTVTYKEELERKEAELDYGP